MVLHISIEQKTTADILIVDTVEVDYFDFKKMAEKDYTSGELLQFLQQQKIETKIEHSKESMELKFEATNRKIVEILNNVDKQVESVNMKIDENDAKYKEVNKIMEDRMITLEKEMMKVNRNKKVYEELREKDRMLKVQPERRVDDKVKKTTEDILSEPVGTFRSSWAKGIQLELQKAADQVEKGDQRMDDIVIPAKTMENGDNVPDRDRWYNDTPASWEEREEEKRIYPMSWR